MSGFAAIDLSALPAPDVIEALDPEAVIADLKQKVAAAIPGLAAVLDLESEPVVKILELWAYEIILHRQRVNDAARAVMLAHATGGDLDNLAALFGVRRLVVQDADSTAVPPVPQVMEADAQLRRRTQLALEGFSTAGPVGAYLFHAFSADGRIVDVAVSSPSPGVVDVVVHAEEADRTPTAAPLSAVEAALNAEDVRDLTAQVQVRQGPMTDTLSIPLRAELAQLQGDLAAAQSELAAAERQTAALRTEFGLLDETSASPKIDTTNIERTLSLLQQSNAQMRALNAGGTVPSVGPTQARAAGGSYNPGWLLTGERGPELRYATRGGFIAHNRQLRDLVALSQRAARMQAWRPVATAQAGPARGGRGSPVVHATIHIHQQPGQSAKALARDVQRELRRMERDGGELHDGGAYA